MKRLIGLVLISCLHLLSGAWAADRIKDIASVAGVRSNQLVGYGLVVGLDRSGDQTTSSPFTAQSMISMLNQLGVHIPQGTSMNPKNVAAVTITATLPPFARRGQVIDVTVSSMGDAKSLRGGTLLLSPLKGADSQVYAMAQGNIVVGGAGASAAGSQTQVNQLNAGRIPAGATVEREVPVLIGNGEFINIELLSADFSTADKVVQAINREFGTNTARAVDGRLIEVRAPYDTSQRVQFLSRLENLTIDPVIVSPLVVINARTGSVVMNQAIRLDPCAVSHGNLTVSVNTTPQVSQPNALAGGRTAVVEKADIQVKQDQGRVINVPRGADLSEVVKALNAVGASPQDLISILQAMKAAGSLRAELQII